MDTTLKKRTNILENTLAKDFSKWVRYYSGIFLNTKYKNLLGQMTVDDVVNDCWVKVLQQNIIYDSSKKSLKGFVQMIVNSVCLDLWRKHKRHFGLLSLNYEFSIEREGSEATTMYETIIDRKAIFEGDIEVRSILDECCDDFNAIELHNIFSGREFGKLDRVIAKENGLKVSEVKNFVSCVFNTVEGRVQDSNRTLESIIYGDEEEFLKEKDRLECVLSYIKEKGGRFSLWEVVKGVMEGLSYKAIGETLGVTGEEVKSFLDKYQPMVV